METSNLKKTNKELMIEIKTTTETIIKDINIIKSDVEYIKKKLEERKEETFVILD
mgnify:CR=1 FL=1|tara:strand:- start:1986 stop:2150 length:165 start_codon:yes stop_codon:yes gene_type:complete